MMGNFYYGIFRAGRGTSAAGIRAVDAPISGLDAKGLSLVLPCTQDPELFFAESPQDVEQAKAMCRGCPVRLACLAGALERAEPWGIWGGELLMNGAIAPGKRPRGRPRKDVVAFGTSSRTGAGDLAQAG
jgi:WhiB family transcriptional regulator, redox-sensing transcriptional regulator